MEQQGLSLAPQATADSSHWWADVRDAVRGVHHDYTEGSVARSLLLLAVPMVLETLMESLFAVCDVFFVSRLGAEAVATVGLTESILTILYAFAIGLSIGAAATVARRVGEKDPDGAARAAVQSVFMGLAFAAVIGVVGILLAPALLRVMGATDGIVRTGSLYAQIMLGGNATVVLLFLLNAVFRGAGDAAIAMRVLWLANAINIVLAPCFVFGLGPFPELGVTGAAVATTIGRGSGVAFQLWTLARGRSRIQVRLAHLGVELGLVRRILRISSAGIVQILIGTTSWVGVVRILSTFGADALAGNTIGIRVIMFALLPAWGLTNAASTMVGQALGAGKPERAEQATWMAARMNLVFLGAVAAVFLALAPILVGIFTREPQISVHAVACLRTVSLGFVFYAFGMVLTGALNGAGDTRTPTWINVACFWCFELPLAYASAVLLGWGPQGVYWAITLAFSAVAVVSTLAFRRGRWKGATI